MKNLMPSFTAEALIAMAAGYGVAPPPLLLMQIGFDPAAEQRTADYWDVIERGSRTLATLHDAVDPGLELKEELHRSVRAMSESRIFVTLARTDSQVSHVLYRGERTVIDTVDEIGNHRLDSAGDAARELERFFDGYQDRDSLTLDIPRDRFESDAQEGESDGSVASELVSDDCTTFVVSIGRPAEGELHILQWRAASDRLFAYEADADAVSFSSMSSHDAAELVQNLLEAMEE